MTLREYLEVRKETLRYFCVRVQIPYNRGRRYFYRLGRMIEVTDFNKIQAATNGLVGADGITSMKKAKVRYTGRGRPPKNVIKKSVKKKTASLAS